MTVRVAATALLAGPAVLAFFTGGVPALPRMWAGLLAWVLAAIGLALGRPEALRRRPALVAVAGLAGLTVWTLLSATWAPEASRAWDTGQLTALYLGVLVAAATLLGGDVRRVEPALVLTALVVVGYGMSERLLPGLLSFDHSASARGRLEQPLTYWNALGAVAALGVVLCARLAGDPSRPRYLRTAAAAAAAPLGMGLYLTVSRGALFACFAGLLTLVVATQRREQLRAIALVVAAAGLAAVAAAPFPGVTELAGSAADRRLDGAIVLGLLALVIATAAVAAHVSAAAERPGPLMLPRGAPLVALAIVVAGFVLAVSLGNDERTAGRLGTGAGRYATFTSNRYAYWKVAVKAFASAPVQGVGGGGWASWWRRERPFGEGARDAHSLYLQTLAELGLVGLALLAAWLAGIAVAARDALRAEPEAAAGLIAGLVVWAAHVALDWDFQMPAATLPAVLLMGALLALTAPRRSAAPRA